MLGEASEVELPPDVESRLISTLDDLDTTQEDLSSDESISTNGEGDMT